jgi:hypothetical protein
MQPYGNNATIGGPSALYTVFSVTRPAGKPCQNRIAPGEPRGWHGQLLFRLFYGQSASKKSHRSAVSKETCGKGAEHSTR